MNKLLLSVSLVLSCILNSSGQNTRKVTTTTKSEAPQIGKINWSIDPFEHALFVENKGQFDTLNNIDGEILFEANVGAATAYFTIHGVFYRHTETEQLDFSHGDPDQNGTPPKKTYYYLTTEWDGSNPNATVQADDELSYYYTYPKGTHETYIANVFKKITYHNIYPGIDITYSFPDGKNDMEYTIIVHPGADLSKIQLKYKNASNIHVDGSGNVLVKNDIGVLKESAPVGYYMEDHASVTITSQVNNPVESFTAHSLDASKTLVIDPVINWTTNPGFSTGLDYAFDLDYDNLGNIYVYGGGKGTQANPAELVKLNPAGAIQWDYHAATMFQSTDFYGDFAVDKHSLECYITEGWNASGGGRQQKISPAGSLVATDPGNLNMSEMWRIESSVCPQGFVIFGNGTTYPYHAAMIDTNMLVTNPVNIIGAACTTGYHDMGLTAVDPFGTYAYTGCTQSLVYTGLWNNVIIKSPMPALAPSAFNAPDHFAFHEIGSMTYDPSYVFNSMNGLVCGRAWLYGYNGDTLKQINKNTGAINAVVKVSTTPYKWGGIDVDLCDNIYVGNNNAIQVYDGTLTLTSTLPTLSGIIYDLSLGTYTSQLLYACGQGFVSSITLGPPATIPIVITKTPTNCSACSGTATASAMPCGVLDTINVSYLWSDGETTRTASHLCSGVDTVHVTVECGLTYTDTLMIPVSAGGITVVRDSTAATCAISGNAAVNVTGGRPPYTYDWSNGSTTSSTGPVGGGTYCVGIRDNLGCFDSLCIDVQGPTLPTITVSPVPDTICIGKQVNITASGAVTYVWTPATGLSCNNCANPNASPISTTIYTVVGTDAHGCTNKDSVQVVVIPSPVVAIAAPTDSICLGGAGVLLQASGASTYTWSPPASNLSCYNCSNPMATPTVTTTYTVRGANSHGCLDSATYTVIVSEPLTLLVTPNMGICPGRTITLSAQQTSGSIGTFQWQPGGSTAPSITVTPTSTQVYTITCTNSCGAVSKDITVRILPVPIPAFEAGPPGCAPLCVQFRNLTSISGGYVAQWAWAFGNGDTVNTQQPIYCYQKSGVYGVTLTATSDSGCSATLKVANLITVYSKPLASFVAAPQPTNILSPTIQFSDKSTDNGRIIYWTWNFGDTTVATSNLQNPSHTYADTGTYCVTLDVMNQNGCIDTATNCIVIDPLFALYIPDAFSPNGDTRNETFTAKGNDVKTFEMYIFDRWGTELFHSNDINNGWPGTVKGSSTICQEDTYIYLIKATDSKGTQHSYTGRVTLIK